MPQRSIVRAHLFEEGLAKLIPDAEEADDFVMAAEYVLSKSPHAGLPVTPKATVWRLPMMPLGGEQISLYYTFDSETVNFLAIGTF